MSSPRLVRAAISRAKKKTLGGIDDDDDDDTGCVCFALGFCRIAATLGISRACVPMTRRNMVVAAAAAAADTWRARRRRVAG
jgi:hypothetical protein